MHLFILSNVNALKLFLIFFLSFMKPSLFKLVYTYDTVLYLFHLLLISSMLNGKFRLL